MQRGNTTSIQEYLTVRQVAELFGLSERTAWDLINDPVDPLPSYRIGRKIVRVRKADAHEWMQRRRSDRSEVDRIVDEVLG